MTQRVLQKPANKAMDILSRLLLPPLYSHHDFVAALDEPIRDLLTMSRSGFEDLIALANTNHVIVRSLEVVLEIMRSAQREDRAAWTEYAFAAERTRIRTALSFLDSVCRAFEDRGYEIAVIKSLDHWPDLGSDLDLYTNADADAVTRLMKTCFDAKTAARSWGDRLARKWNFLIQGLPEAIEIHVGRLGQTGEQAAFASALMRRSRSITIGDFTFRVPSSSDRLIISTLQRMYRHYYFRLTDIVDAAALVEAGGVDYGDLRAAAKSAGIWEGVATYLLIVSDYVKRYRGTGIDLPRWVLNAARFGGDTIYYSNQFLRVPILPQSASLYGSQLAGMLRKRELQNGARLGLLPLLATAAVVGQKITGSDKGIW
jgi:hypothetical protein